MGNLRQKYTDEEWAELENRSASKMPHMPISGLGIDWMGSIDTIMGRTTMIIENETKPIEDEKDTHCPTYNSVFRNHCKRTSKRF